LRKRYKCYHRICKHCWEKCKSSKICPVSQCGARQVEKPSPCGVF
jgi:hypothetical protein